MPTVTAAVTLPTAPVTEPTAPVTDPTDPLRLPVMLPVIAVMFVAVAITPAIVVIAAVAPTSPPVAFTAFVTNASNTVEGSTISSMDGIWYVDLLHVICTRPSVSTLPVVSTIVYCPLAISVRVAADANAVSVPPFLLIDRSPITAEAYSAPVESSTGPMITVAAVLCFAHIIGCLLL